MNDTIGLQIAASGINVQKDAALGARILDAMKQARDPKREGSIFWMQGRLDDDFRLRTALAAVMLAGSDEDKDIITRSLQPMKMLAAAASGIPVDFTQLPSMDDLLPLMKFWQAADPALPQSGKHE